MRFYALRVVCQSCGSSFLVGGGTGNDLTRWKKVTVDCRRCSAEIAAVGGEAVDLCTVPDDRGAGGAGRTASGARFSV